MANTDEVRLTKLAKRGMCGQTSARVLVALARFAASHHGRECARRQFHGGRCGDLQDVGRAGAGADDRFFHADRGPACATSDRLPPPTRFRTCTPWEANR